MSKHSKIIRKPKLKGKSSKEVPEYGWGGGIQGGVSGAAQGAQLGFSVGGPWGAAIGAGAGLIYGAYQGSKAEDEQKKIENNSAYSAYLKGLEASGATRFKQGGQINKQLIEVEGDELEVDTKGHIIKDYKGKNSHIDGGFKTLSKSGNIIIPHKFRQKFLDGDDVSKQTIIQQLKRDQVKRDNLELDTFRSMEDVEYGKGGQIHIKPENKGKFTEAAKRAGMGVQEYAKHVLAHKDQHSSTLIKRANFARNASKFKHEEGGTIKKYGGDLDNNEFSLITSPDETNDVMENIIQPAFDKEFKRLPSERNRQMSAGVNNALTYAPIAYDMIKGLEKPTYLNQEDYQNPYETQALSLMRNRKVDMTPIRQRMLANRQSALRNAKESQSLSGGAYLSNANQIEANTQNAMANAQMQEQDINNRYRGEEASTLANLGADRARTKLGIKDINLRNIAATNAHTAKATEGVSKAALMKQRYSNAGSRDAALASVLQEMFPDSYNSPEFLEYFEKLKNFR